MDRDMSDRPYTDDERRVCDFIQELSNGTIGCGDDPIGFIIASYRLRNHQIRVLKDKLIEAGINPDMDADDGKGLLQAAWTINDHFRVGPGGEIEYTGSTNDLDRLKEVLHRVDPTFDPDAAKFLNPLTVITGGKR